MIQTDNKKKNDLIVKVPKEEAIMLLEQFLPERERQIRLIKNDLAYMVFTPNRGMAIFSDLINNETGRKTLWIECLYGYYIVDMISKIKVLAKEAGYNRIGCAVEGEPRKRLFGRFGFELHDCNDMYLEL